jgi:phospholipase D3/4
VSINAFYMTLTQGSADWPPEAGGAQGQSVYNAIVAAVKRGVHVRLIVGWPPIEDIAAEDPASLEAAGVEVRRLNWTAATGLKGVLHSKFMLIDQSSAYIGSANFDWRSLSMVKELGIILSNCSVLTQDVQLLFEQHWSLAQPGATVPKQWDVEYWPVYNNNTPLLMRVGGAKVAAFVAVSPPSLCPPTRTSDTDAILSMFRNANTYVRMSVMEYSPFYLYVTPTTIWPVLDNEIRLAALRGVKISFIHASWTHTAIDTIPYLQSLDVLPNVEVRVLVVPPWTTSNGTKVPYTRVDHAKYIISDNGYYISTSNWTPDYFLATSGISLTMVSKTENWREMDASFASDWSSPYTMPLFQKYPPV